MAGSIDEVLHILYRGTVEKNYSKFLSSNLKNNFLTFFLHARTKLICFAANEQFICSQSISGLVLNSAQHPLK